MLARTCRPPQHTHAHTNTTTFICGSIEALGQTHRNKELPDLGQPGQRYPKGGLLHWLSRQPVHLHTHAVESRWVLGNFME